MPDSLLAEEALSGLCFLPSAFDCCDGGTRGHFPLESSASEHSFSSSEHKAGRQATLRQTGRLLNVAHTLAQRWSEAMRKVAVKDGT